MATKKETLLSWLKDAHGMENASVTMMEKQVKRLDEHPEIQNKIKQHLEESREQQRMVKECIERLGGEVSSIKQGMGSFVSNVQAMMSAASGDEVVKNSLANFGFENFEIASYKSLIAAADDLGEQEIKQTCETILQQEQRMAQWVEEHIPQVTKEYTKRTAASHA